MTIVWMDGFGNEWQSAPIAEFTRAGVRYVVVADQRINTFRILRITDDSAKSRVTAEPI